MNKLVSGSLLARNSVRNLFGQAAPLAVAVFAIPKLIEQLGTDKFGALAIAWMVIGYFGLFDLGMGRALTTLVAQHLGRREQDRIPDVIWTGGTLIVTLGIFGAGLLALSMPWLVRHALHVPIGLQHQVIQAFVLLALSIPAVISGTSFRGVLEAHQRFDLVNYVRIPLGVYIFVAPIFVLPFSTNLVPIVGVLTLGIFGALIAYLLLCMHVVPELKTVRRWSPELVVPLLKRGGWMTVSNVVSPFLANSDRFVIGAMLSLQAVTYYATPYEAVTKMLILPGALSGVLFPAFSTSIEGDKSRSSKIFVRAVQLLILVLFPLVLLTAFFSPEILKLWVGADFATHSATVMRILLLGVFVNGLAWLPFVFLQGVGRPDLTAKAHLIELPLYGCLVLYLTHNYGIQGTATAWAIRALVDSLLLFRMSENLLNEKGIFLRVAGSVALVIVGIGLAVVVVNPLAKAILVIVVLVPVSFAAFSFANGVKQEFGIQPNPVAGQAD